MKTMVGKFRMLLFLSLTSMFFFACTNAAEPNYVVDNKTMSVSNVAELFLPSQATSDVPNYAVRSRVVNIETDQFLKALKAGKIKSLTLNFFNDAKFRVIRKKQNVNSSSGSITWIGEIPSKPSGSVVLVVSPKGIHGSFNVPDMGLFTVRSLSNKSHIIEEIKRSAIR